MTHHADPHHDHGHGSGFFGHILPMKVYLGIYLLLVVLTVVTVWASYLQTGPTMHMIVAMVIASVKALLVALFFMHLKYEDKFTWLYAFFPLLLLTFMMAGIFIDNPYRVHTTPAGYVEPAKEPAAEAAKHH